jgi:hypothetical protein
MAYSTPLHGKIDLEPYLIPYLGSGHEDYKALNSGYTIPSASGVFNLGIIFGASRHCDGRGRILHRGTAILASEHFSTSLRERLE